MLVFQRSLLPSQVTRVFGFVSCAEATRANRVRARFFGKYFYNQSTFLARRIGQCFFNAVRGKASKSAMRVSGDLELVVSTRNEKAHRPKPKHSLSSAYEHRRFVACPEAQIQLAF